MKAFIAVVNPDMPHKIKNSLKNYGYRVISVPPCREVAPPLAGHPDLQICPVNDYIVHHPKTDKKFLNQLADHYSLVPGKTILGHLYPNDIAYNVAITGKYAFHKCSRTDTSLVNTLENLSILSVNVKQGYSKCSSAVVSETSLITADRGIHEAALAQGISSLLIEPGHINLSGYSYGFIGGATACDDKGFYVAGSLKKHPQYREIYDFVEKNNRDFIELGREKAIDTGSFFLL